jgi:hypothetical protein
VSDKKEEPKLVEVKLDKAHTHAGIDCAAGTKISVTEPERDWLVGAEVIKTTTPREAK